MIFWWIVRIALWALAGYVAARLMNTSLSLIWNIVLGLVGGAVGSLAAGLIGIGSTNMLGGTLISVAGASIWRGCFCRASSGERRVPCRSGTAAPCPASAGRDQAMLSGSLRSRAFAARSCRGARVSAPGAKRLRGGRCGAVIRGNLIRSMPGEFARLESARLFGGCAAGTVFAGLRAQTGWRGAPDCTAFGCRRALRAGLAAL